MHDPWSAPGVRRQADVRTQLVEHVSELGANQFAEGLGWKQELLLGRMPAAIGIGKAAAGDGWIRQRPSSGRRSRLSGGCARLPAAPWGR
jgi:hypothetical protein